MARPLLPAILLVAGLLAAPSPADARGVVTDGPTYQMPTVGSCLQVVATDYHFMTPKTPVDCATEHTVVVTAVEVLPADTDWTIDSDDLRAAEDQYCLPAYYDTLRALGANFKAIAKTAYNWRYATPNAAQRGHGASWIRCDITLSGAALLLPLPSPLLVGNQVPRSITSCLLVLDDGVFSSVCTDNYNYEFEKVFVMPQDAYPTNAQARKFAKSHCPAAKQHLKYRALWSYEPAWNYGDHTMRCYRALDPS